MRKKVLPVLFACILLVAPVNAGFNSVFLNKYILDHNSYLRKSLRVVSLVGAVGLLSFGAERGLKVGKIVTRYADTWSLRGYNRSVLKLAKKLVRPVFWSAACVYGAIKIFKSYKRGV
ncbi:hypothetical protein ACFLYU_03000 [Candidatus Dependentiae bacterium]